MEKKMSDSLLLSLGQIIKIIAPNNDAINKSFCQFRTQESSDYFKVLGTSNKKKFPIPLSELGSTIKVSFNDRDGKLYDLNNKNHSFTLKITHLNSPYIIPNYLKK